MIGEGFSGRGGLVVIWIGARIRGRVEICHWRESGGVGLVVGT